MVIEDCTPTFDHADLEAVDSFMFLCVEWSYRKKEYERIECNIHIYIY